MRNLWKKWRETGSIDDRDRSGRPLALNEQEVKELDKKGLRNNQSASQAIGYRQALEFLDSPQTPHDYEAFIMKFKKATRHFAKRQFTWFRKEPLFRWLDISLHPKERLKELILQDFEQGLPNT